MYDLNFDFGSFNTTCVIVSFTSMKGKAFLEMVFGPAAAMVTLPKSQAPDLASFAAQNGLTWN